MLIIFLMFLFLFFHISDGLLTFSTRGSLVQGNVKWWLCFFTVSYLGGLSYSGQCGTRSIKTQSFREQLHCVHFCLQHSALTLSASLSAYYYSGQFRYTLNWAKDEVLG